MKGQCFVIVTYKILKPTFVVYFVNLIVQHWFTKRHIEGEQPLRLTIHKKIGNAGLRDTTLRGTYACGNEF